MFAKNQIVTPYVGDERQGSEQKNVGAHLDINILFYSLDNNIAVVTSQMCHATCSRHFIYSFLLSTAKHNSSKIDRLRYNS